MKMQDLDFERDRDFGRDVEITPQKPDLRAYLLGGQKVDNFEVVREADTERQIDIEDHLEGLSNLSKIW